MTTQGPDALHAGTVVGGFRVEGVLGRGAFGTVYRAARIADGTGAALKIMSARVLLQVGGPERFRREAALVERLQHPNVVRVLGAGEDGGLLYTAFELLEGRTGDDVLASGPVGARRLATLGIELARGLEEAHRVGVVHRDLKPGNVFIEKTASGERGKLLDFGVAKSISTHTVAGLTQEGTALGTPAYMAPEQLAGLPAAPTADLFALGLVLAELAMGRPVYDANVGAYEILKERLAGTRPPLPPELMGGPFGAVIERATTPDPEHRTKSATELREGLEAILRALPADPPAAATSVLSARPRTSVLYVPEPTRAVAVAAAHLGAAPAPAPPPIASAPPAPMAPAQPSRLGLVAIAAIGVASVAGVAIFVATRGGASTTPTGRASTTSSEGPAALRPSSVGDATAPSASARAPGPSTFEPLPLAVGQWIRMKTTRDGRDTLVEYRIVEARGEALVFEVEVDGGASITEMVIVSRDRMRVDGVALKSARVKAGSNVVELPASATGPILADLQNTLHLPAFDPKRRADVKVAAGAFDACFVRDVDADVLGRRVVQTAYAHPSVPINALVRSEGTVDGKPSTTELLAFGLSGAKRAMR